MQTLSYVLQLCSVTLIEFAIVDRKTKASSDATRSTHYEISARIRNFPGPNAGKYGPEKLRIQTLFTQ